MQLPSGQPLLLETLKVLYLYIANYKGENASRQISLNILPVNMFHSRLGREGDGFLSYHVVFGGLTMETCLRENTIMSDNIDY